MTSVDEKRRWVPDADVHPMTNMYGRRWRVVNLNGSVTTGTFFGQGSGPDYRAAAEWLFEETQE